MSIEGEDLAGGVILYAGDCLEVLSELAENSIDACVCDPPYHLQSIHKRFAAKGRDETSERYAAGPYGRTAKGFMGKKWDGGDVAFRVETWQAILRVLKPGGHLLAFSGTRTYHRMAVAVDDAGFEVRDMIQWLYGSGFPKSHDVSKGIDRVEGAEREQVRDINPRNPKTTGGGRDGMEGATRPWIEAAIERGYHEKDGPIPATAAAAAWDGWGSALKPACEPIVLARKPLIGTIAENVLKWGTGALNIDGCRVDWAGIEDVAAVGFAESRARGTSTQSNSIGKESRDGANTYDPLVLKGRWPANVVLDSSDEVVRAFPNAPGQQRTVGAKPSVNVYGDYGAREQFDPRSDSGSAARFFYQAKADSDDRLGSKHPTVKPLDLMQWLVRLVTRKGGLVLDPFAGTGTTGEAAIREGMRCVLIEREAEYQNDIRRRMKLAMSGPDERARESIKARGLTADPGPLFGGSETTRGGGRLSWWQYAIRHRPAP